MCTIKWPLLFLIFDWSYRQTVIFLPLRESSLHAITLWRHCNWKVSTNYITGDIIVMTESLQTIANWVYRMDATMTLTGNHKKMSVDDATVQTANKVNAASRINRNEHGRQLLHVVLESRIDPMNPVTHAAGCFEHLIWSNSPTKRHCWQSTEYWMWTAQAVWGIMARQLYWWMYQLFFGQLSDQ